MPYNKNEFDRFASSYSELVNKDVKMFGGNAEYFHHNRLDCLKRWVVKSDQRLTIMDYGCGIGTLSGLMAWAFRNANVYGCDISTESIKIARTKWGHLSNLNFESHCGTRAEFQLIVLSNVIHHVKEEERHSTLLNLKQRLKEEGRLVVFEHNPLNPLTRYVVKRSPIDVEAKMIRARDLLTLAEACGFRKIMKRYITFFPSFLKCLKPIEPILSPLPLGAQYMAVLKSEKS